MLASMLAVLSSRRILAAIFISLVILLLNAAKIGYDDFREAPEMASRVTPVLHPTLSQHGISRADTPTLDIVVSMYKENLTALAEDLHHLRDLPCFQGIDIRTIIYTKDDNANLSSIYHATNATQITQLPNAGREGGTYLSHILLAWDDLARHTIFIQAALHHASYVRQRITHNFNARTGVLPLQAMAACVCHSCTDAWNSQVKFQRLAEIYSALNSKLCPEEITICYSGQILVSARRIRRRKKEIYEHLKGVLESDMDHWIHKDEKADWFADEVTNPYFGHTIERSYMVLWGCDDTSIVQKCAEWERLVEGGVSQDKEVPGWCQCLDGDER
jgi:hypothetical protein